MNYNTLEIILSFLFILLAGFLASAEMAIASFGNNKIEELKERGDKLADSFKEIQSISDFFFGTIQITSVIFMVLASFLMYDVVLKVFTELFRHYQYLNPFQTKLLVIAISLLIVAPLIVIFSVLIPKAIGFKYAEKIGRSSVKILLLLTKVFKIPVRLANSASNVLLTPFDEKTNFTQTRFSEDEIRIIISEGVKSGALNETEQEIIENVFEFNDLRANEVMIPRTEMIAIDIEESIDEVKKIIFETPYTQLPVYQNSLDNILGVLNIKDFFRVLLDGKDVKITELVCPAYFIPEYKLISEVFSELQNRGERIAIVMDEYGGTEGFLTMEDIVGEIVGEVGIPEEDEEKEIIKNQDGSFTVLGTMFIEDFNNAFNKDLPTSDEYNTVSGFVADKTGKILELNDKLEFEGLIFTLEEKERQKMVKFKVVSLDNNFDLSEES